MTHMPTAVRVRDLDANIVVDMHDHENGLTVLETLDVPGSTRRYSREKYARISGSYRVGGPSVADDGSLVVKVRVEGDTWAQTTTRFVALLADLQGAEEFFVETELDGVRTRWYCDAPPDVLPEPITVTARLLHRQEYEVRFVVQPNPSITII